jgi:DMSO/TMAO reductase YedYZ molybdopterin-dependent catalytic subunit
MPEPTPQAPNTGEPAQHAMRRLTRRSFITGAVAAVAGLGARRWLATAEPQDGMAWPLRRVLRGNEWLADGLYAPTRLAPTFPAERVSGAGRINGLVGLASAVDAANWHLRLQHEGRPEQVLALGDVLGLARHDLVTELKCVEGWSEVMHFGGVRFLDFVTRFGLATRSGRPTDPQGNPQDLYRYVYLATPDEDYHVGLDMASALHPQTLLCDRMNGQPLTGQHGAPLRLYLAVKYGFKSLKRIGVIRFQDERPPDYWAARGYDWYAAL